MARRRRDSLAARSSRAARSSSYLLASFPATLSLAVSHRRLDALSRPSRFAPFSRPLASPRVISARRVVGPRGRPLHRARGRCGCVVTPGAASSGRLRSTGSTTRRLPLSGEGEAILICHAISRRAARSPLVPLHAAGAHRARRRDDDEHAGKKERGAAAIAGQISMTRHPTAATRVMHRARARRPRATPHAPNNARRHTRTDRACITIVAWPS